MDETFKIQMMAWTLLFASDTNQITNMTTIGNLLELLAANGGAIVSTASLSPEWIEQARASGRMYVDSNGLGFVWEPALKFIFPTNDEQLAEFDKWYPLKVELPEHLKTPDFLFKKNFKR